MPSDPIRIEDQMLIIHGECGGIMIGELGKVLHCDKCGMEMDAFVLDPDELKLLKPRLGLRIMPRRASRN